MPSYPAPGIIIGEGVRIRQKASLESEVVGKASTGEKLQIMEVVESTDTSKLDACEVYPMVRIKTASGATGWVFGKFVYEILKEEPFTSLNPVAFDNRMLALKLCRNFGLGVEDEGGLTGCWEYYPVLLVDTKTGESFLVSMPKPQNSVPDFKYWSLESDEGAAETIQSWEANQGKITARIFAEHMEGCSKYQLNITKSAKGFVATCSDQYKTVDNSECEKLAR